MQVLAIQDVVVTMINLYVERPVRRKFKRTSYQNTRECIRRSLKHQFPLSNHC